jgi:hypothetical protein
VHPYTLKPVRTVKTREEKLNQNRYFFWYKKENKDWIRQRLQKAKRPDLLEKLLEPQPEAQVPKWLSEKRKKR